MRLLLLAAVLCACKATGTFKCMSSDQCRLGDEVGFCEDAGYCTFADPACETHRRYDETAEYPLAGACLTGYVTGQIAERYIVNDEAGAPTVVTQTPTLAVAALLDDGTSPTVRIEHDGHFSFAAPPGSHYSLSVPVLGELQASLPHIEAASLAGWRPDVVRSTKATSIKFTYNQAALGPVWIQSSGAYTETITTGTATNFNFDWFTATTPGTGAKAALLDSTMHHDRLYVNQTASIGGYVSIVASATERLTLTDGIAAAGTATLAPSTRDQCVQLRTTAVAEQARLKAAEASLGNMSSGWRLQAAQARDLTDGASFSIAAHDDTTPTNAGLDVTYANPFPGTSMLGLMYVQGNYNIAAAGFNVSANMWSYTYEPFDPVAGSCAATLSLAGTTAIGGALVVAGTMIDANNKDVTADLMQPVSIAWSQVVSGISHFWTVSFWEVSDDGTGGQVFELKYTLTTPDTHARLPKGLLQSSHTYIAQIVAVQGPPNAAQGDFATYAYPSGSTGAWSHSFKIK